MTAISQSDLLQALGWAVFNSLWQMAILWVAYQFIVSVFRIKSSSNKSSLATVLLFAGFAWFTVTFVATLANSDRSAAIYATMMQIDGNADLNMWLTATLPIASILYLLLLMFPVLNFIRNFRYVQVIRRYGLSRADVQLRMFVQKTAVRMDIRKQVYVWMSDLVSSPVTIGYIKPIILLPVAAMNHLSMQQIEAVLLHELSHIKRYDYFINLLTRLIQTVLYFNPFVKAFIRIIETEREKSCDETVMQFQYEPHGYASALLALEKAAHIPHHALTLGASDGKKSEFRQRIEWIMGIRNKPGFSFNKLAGVMGGLLCFIGLNALLILSKPVKTAIAKNTYSFISSPYDLFADPYDKTTNAEMIPEHKNRQAIVTNGNVASTNATEKENGDNGNAAVIPHFKAHEISDPNMLASQLKFVYDLQTVIPQLDALKEKQVQTAIEESKKVLKETQWKEVEKTIADALTRVEKQQVKEEYEKAISKIDWDQMGDKLRVAYDKIDWNMINTQLNNALTEIKMDSLQQVYTIAIENLSCIEKELEKRQQQGVPDTDLDLKSIEIKKGEMQKAIDKIKNSKPKTIIHL